MTDEILASDLHDARTIWDYHLMHHQLAPVDVGIGLGSHDLGVATVTAKLHDEKLFPSIVFTGATSRTTAARFPRARPCTTENTRSSSVSPPPRSWSRRMPPTLVRT